MEIKKNKKKFGIGILSDWSTNDFHVIRIGLHICEQEYFFGFMLFGIGFRIGVFNVENLG